MSMTTPMIQFNRDEMSVLYPFLAMSVDMQREFVDDLLPSDPTYQEAQKELEGLIILESKVKTFLEQNLNKES